MGADWSNYVEYYQSGYAPDKLSGNYEPVFMVLRDICYYLHFDYELFSILYPFLPCYALDIREGFLM